MMRPAPAPFDSERATLAVVEAVPGPSAWPPKSAKDIAVEVQAATGAPVRWTVAMLEALCKNGDLQAFSSGSVTLANARDRAWLCYRWAP